MVPAHLSYSYLNLQQAPHLLPHYPQRQHVSGPTGTPHYALSSLKMAIKISPTISNQTLPPTSPPIAIRADKESENKMAFCSPLLSTHQSTQNKAINCSEYGNALRRSSTLMDFFRVVHTVHAKTHSSARLVS